MYVVVECPSAEKQEQVRRFLSFFLQYIIFFQSYQDEKFPYVNMFLLCCMYVHLIFLQDRTVKDSQLSNKWYALLGGIQQLREYDFAIFDPPPLPPHLVVVVEYPLMWRWI